MQVYRYVWLFVTLSVIASAQAPTDSEAPVSAQHLSPALTKNEKDESRWSKTAIKLTYFFDTRGYPTINLLTSRDNLPGGLSFWGFTDWHGTQRKGQPTEITRHFMEYRLSRALGKGFSAQAEFDDLSGPKNHVLRFGLTYKHALPHLRKGVWLQWRVFPVESDGKGGQASVLFALPLTKRLSLSGFVDCNWKRRAWVAEPQLNYSLHKRLRLVVEFRHNDFERGALKPGGVAIGLETTLQ